MPATSLVLLSGGQDSITCLAYATTKHGRCHALTLDYGQRHSIEMECAKIAAKRFDCLSWEKVNVAFPVGVSAMNSESVPVATSGSKHDAELPSTFLPGRNMVFLALAASYAAALKCDYVITGVCQTDYSGYPDCRAVFIDAMNDAITHAMGSIGCIPIIETPLMDKTKAETFKMAADLGCLDFVIEHSHTCYMGNHTDLHDWGYGCGVCPACLLRKKGWDRYVSTLKP